MKNVRMISMIIMADKMDCQIFISGMSSSYKWNPIISVSIMIANKYSSVIIMFHRM